MCNRQYCYPQFIIVTVKKNLFGTETVCNCDKNYPKCKCN